MRMSSRIIQAGAANRFPPGWFPAEASRFTKNVDGQEVFVNISGTEVEKRIQRMAKEIGVEVKFTV